MKKIVLTFGMFAGLINVGTGILLVNLAGEEMVHANSQWIGYLVMIIALSMIFVGIKQYRDEHLGGVIKFGKAFLTGLYIALIASAIYVGVWELYLQVSGVDFIANYQASMIENMQADGASQAEISAMKDQMEFYAEMYENPFLRILITLSEILPVGLNISLISAALLRKSTFFPSNKNIDPEAQAI